MRVDRCGRSQSSSPVGLSESGAVRAAQSAETDEVMRTLRAKLRALTEGHGAGGGRRVSLSRSLSLSFRQKHTARAERMR